MFLRWCVFFVKPILILYTYFGLLYSSVESYVNKISRCILSFLFHLVHYLEHDNFLLYIYA